MASKIKKSDKKKRSRMNFGSFLTRSSYNDTQEYRNNYPGKRDDPDLDDNYKFYMNQISSKPSGDYIEKIHEKWWGDYGQLERHHGYIQWLFPIRESGMNWHSQELQLHEIEKLKKNRRAMARLLKSYEMMLDFYGMKLANKENGEIKRGDNWKDRFRHLNRSYHNYLRITRILKCLGEFGYENLKSNFVRFVLKEAIIKETLDNLLESCMKFWVGVIRSDEERNELLQYYDQLIEGASDYSDENEEDSEEDESAEEEEDKVKKGDKSEQKGKSKKSESQKTKLKAQAAEKDTGESETDVVQSKHPRKDRKLHEMSDSGDDEELNKHMDLLEDGDNEDSNGSHEAEFLKQSEDTQEYSLKGDEDDSLKDENDTEVIKNGSEHVEKEGPSDSTEVSVDTNTRTGAADKASDEMEESEELEKKTIPDKKDESKNDQKPDTDAEVKMADTDETMEENEGNESQKNVSMETADSGNSGKGDGTAADKDEMETE